MKSILFLASLFLSFFNSAQTFEDIKNEPINLEIIESGSQIFINKMYRMVGEDLDSLDIQILSSGPILGNLLVFCATENDACTFDDLYQKFLGIKQNPKYEKVRGLKVVENELYQLPADINNWEKDKLLIEKFVSDSQELERIRLYVSQNSNPNETYETLMLDYRKMRAEEEAQEKKKYSSFLRENLNESNLFNEEAALAKGLEENKPIILYFTGYNCVNCRKIERNTLFEPQIAQSLKENFILFSLYVDDQNELPETEKKTVTYGERTKILETVGDAHMYYQISRFELSGQPYFIVLNNDNEIIGIASYKQNDINDFQQFLDESLEAYEN